MERSQFMKFRFPKIRLPKNIELPKIKFPSEILAMLLVFLLMSLAFLPSLEITPPNRLTARKFAAQCEKIGYTLVDESAQYHDTFYTEVYGTENKDYTVRYYTFSNRAYAKALYVHFLGYIQTGARTEKYTYNSNYNRFYTSTEAGVYFMYRNMDTMIYIHTTPDRAADIDALIETLKL